MTELIFQIGAYLIFLSVIYKQQRTIDRLTDKLMAKDYREYVNLTKPPDITDDTPKRKPLSWHDDPYIEIEEESH